MWHNKEESIKLIALSASLLAACVVYLSVEPLLVSWFIPLDDRIILAEAEKHIE